jgi:ribose transport system ATP-binding protein
MSDTANGTLLRVEGVTKRFPGVVALDGVSFELRKGEVHALVGENGAGKSTLMKILSGVYRPDEGTIFYRGKPVTFRDATEAQHAGISIIYQELNLIPHLSVAQNIFIGREPMRWGFVLDEGKMNRDATELLAKLHITIDPTVILKSLPLSKQQMVEVAKALSYDSDILIMDEPTSALSEAEIDELFKVIHTLRGQGVGIIYISHRLEELKHIVDRVTVFRDGQHISTDPYASITLDEVVNRMVGRSLEHKFPARSSKPSTTKILEVKHLSRAGVLKDISFDLYRGEILGIAGLMGAGRTELARAVFGADTRDGGEILLSGKKLQISSPIDGIRAGIAYLPEDRKRDGLAVKMLLSENVSMANLAEVCGPAGIISSAKERRAAERFIRELAIKTPSVDQVVNNLSGGNQQKVVVAKWLFRNSKVLLFDEPTRGIDVGAKFAIHELIDVLAREGVGIIMISSELSEILGMTDRVLVLHEGRLEATLITRHTTQEEILNYAAGLAGRTGDGSVGLPKTTGAQGTHT